MSSKHPRWKIKSKFSNFFNPHLPTHNFETFFYMYPTHNLRFATEIFCKYCINLGYLYKYDIIFFTVLLSFWFFFRTTHYFDMMLFIFPPDPRCLLHYVFIHPPSLSKNLRPPKIWNLRYTTRNKELSLQKSDNAVFWWETHANNQANGTRNLVLFIYLGDDFGGIYT